LQNAEKANPSTLANIVSAINVKASNDHAFGVNATVSLPILAIPTALIGIDVYHPPPKSERMSEAAMSVSINMSATRYYSTIRTQTIRQESIGDIQGMFAEAFVQALKHMPPYEQVVIFRDGVGDKQFKTLCKDEIIGFENAVKAIPAYHGKIPKLLYLIAQKRNITRLAVNENDKYLTPPPGTVVDDVITGTDGMDFFILPHAPVIGSAKPIHIHVLDNRLGLSNDAIQKLLYDLCHLHPGCTRAVSLPIPLYNAHKLAYRIGQVYRAAEELHYERQQEAASDTSSIASGGSGKETAIDYKPIVLPDFLKFNPFFL